MDLRSCALDRSPTSAVGEIATQTTRKPLLRRYNFVSIKSHTSNLKGIIEQNRPQAAKTKRTKKLSWFDDKENRYKPFTLKTDASMDCDSVSISTDNFADCSAFNVTDEIKAYLAKKRTHAGRWVPPPPDADQQTAIDTRNTSESSDHLRRPSDSDLATWFSNTAKKTKHKVLRDYTSFWKEWKLSLADLANMGLYDRVNEVSMAPSKDERMVALEQVELIKFARH